MSQFKDISFFFKPSTLAAVAASVFSVDYIQDVIIELSQDKLRRGEDSDNVGLQTDKSDPRLGGGIYSPNNEKNYNQSFVDLYVSGKFYKSFDVVVKKTFFELRAEFKKGKNNIFDNFQGSYSDNNTFEAKILGLQDSDLEIFIDSVFLPATIANFESMVLSVVS